MSSLMIFQKTPIHSLQKTPYSLNFPGGPVRAGARPRISAVHAFPTGMPAAHSFFPFPSLLSMREKHCPNKRSLLCFNRRGLVIASRRSRKGGQGEVSDHKGIFYETTVGIS
jgi:hypothetical protein